MLAKAHSVESISTLDPLGGRNAESDGMWKTRAVAALVVTLGALGTLETLALTPPAAAAADDAKSVVENASLAMGVVGMTSITFSGAAAVGNFGQSRTISFGLASTSIRNYVRTIDFNVPASHATGDHAAAGPAVRGGPLPPMRHVRADRSRPATPAWVQQMQIWATPWGFLIGAAANNATVKSQKINGVPYKVVTWSPAQKSPSGLPYKSDRLHRRRQPRRTRRNVGRASRHRRSAPRILLHGLSELRRV